jgi:hypothetical protein
MLARVLGAVALGVIVVGSLPVLRSSGSVVVSAAEVLAQPQAACTGYCIACNGTSGHVAEPFDEICQEQGCRGDAKQGDGWHPNSCLGLDNCSNHVCSDAEQSPEAAALPAHVLYNHLAAAIEARDVALIRKILNSNPARTELVGSRRAIQLVACDGAVTAHLPLGRLTIPLIAD